MNRAHNRASPLVKIKLRTGGPAMDSVDHSNGLPTVPGTIPDRGSLWF